MIFCRTIPHQPKRLLSISLLLLSSMQFAACTGNFLGRSSGEDSQQALREGRYETGLALLDQEAKESPGDGKIRATLARERLQAANKLSIAGEQARREGRYDEAEQNFRRALGIEPGHVRATQGLAQIGIDQRHLGLLRDASAALKKGDQALAQSLLRTVLAQEPGNREAQGMLTGIEENKAALLQSAAKAAAPLANR